MEVTLWTTVATPSVIEKINLDKPSGCRLSMTGGVLLVGNLFPFALALVPALLYPRSTACISDKDCSLNGLCTNGSCVCDPPWGGGKCGVLQFAPAPVTGAYGEAPNVTSWGGNAVLGDDGSWHGYFTEISGAGCGLAQWKAQSTVVHAVASGPEGPYSRRGVVLSHEAHNPHVLRVPPTAGNNSSWYIFHIGSADAASNASACPGPVPPSGRVVTKHAVHVSRTGPAGPFAPLAIDGAFEGCNNPAPLLHPNGTTFLGCTWSLRRAPRPEGPWSKAWSIAPKNAHGRTWLGRSWEDPYIWVDARGHWHLLAHTYTDDVFPKLSYAGHGFSVDGHAWHFGKEEPYGGGIARADGTVKHYATLERPKLLFADPAHPLRPTHLLNGASPVWDASNNASSPCGACRTAGQCVGCKVSPGMDWTYTVVRPLVK